MIRPRVVIFDDETERLQKWKQCLENSRDVASQFEIGAFTHEEFLVGLRQLAVRQDNARTSGRPFDGQDCIFDDVDILIVDFDLNCLGEGTEKEGRVDITGEEVIYRVRCFSRCKVVVTLNRREERRSFDLTLRGFAGSLADAHIPSTEIANPGLWSDVWSGFRPSYWPRLDRLAQNFSERKQHLLNSDNLNRPIVELLGFDNDVLDLLPRYMAEYLTPDELMSASVSSFVFDSGNCLRRKDIPVRVGRSACDPEWIAQIAAARLAYWLEQVVLPAQDVLVDLPHAVDRFPSLFDGANPDVTASVSDWKVLPVNEDVLEKALFKNTFWLSRPVWWWAQLSADERLPEVSKPWTVSFSDSLFCEDFSRFIPSKQTREFLADVVSSFDRRRVVDKEEIEDETLKRAAKDCNYYPMVRFLM